MDFRINHLESLHWLWGVGALVAVMVVGIALRRRDLIRFADSMLLPRLLPATGLTRRYVRAGLLAATLVLLVAARIDPRWGVSYEQVHQRGVDVVVVLDVSKSMLADDAKPNRLQRARQFIDELVEQLGGDRVALVTFAGNATLKCPLTIDRGAFRLALATATPENAPRGGSLLGDALRVAAQAFTDDLPDHKAIIVFSDGEDHGSYPVDAARSIAGERSIPIYTVGLGDADEGSRIPVGTTGRRRYVTYDGQQVWSKMDPTVLRDLALATGGAFFPVGTGTLDMGRLYQERIEPVAKREFEAATVRKHHPRFQWFAGLAMILLLIDTLMGDRRAAPARSSPREVMA